MNAPFVFSTEIPQSFALAVLHITTQRGKNDDWSTVRSYWSLDRNQAEIWILELTEDNVFAPPFDSIGWWKTQIIGQ